MNVPDFYNPKDVEAFYSYDGDQYAVQEGNVFKMIEDKGYEYTKEITPAQLEIYGESLIEKPTILELKILAVNEKTDGTAIITGEDGSGLELTFEDEDYKNRKDKYEIVRFYGENTDISYEARVARDFEDLDDIDDDYTCW